MMEDVANRHRPSTRMEATVRWVLTEEGPKLAARDGCHVMSMQDEPEVSQICDGTERG
jgi:hypothetical protein